MQVCERPTVAAAVQRDFDLIREILLRVEQDPMLDGTRWIVLDPARLRAIDRSREEIGYHLTMLIQEGFLEGVTGGETIPPISKLTWKGHELLDDIRDPDIWTKTKDRVKGLSTIGVQLFWELAKAEIKKKLGLT
jgi:hypothetical protein